MVGGLEALSSDLVPSAVTVDDFHVARALRSPTKTDPVLVINTDAVNLTKITFQLLKPIAGRRSEIVKFMGLVELVQLPLGDRPTVLRARFARHLRGHTIENVPAPLARKRVNHPESCITGIVMHGKHGLALPCCRFVRPRCAARQ